MTRGVAHIKATFNNTMVTITDTNGETISWASAGTVGFKGARKSTPFAAGRAAENAAQQARKSGMVEVEVKVKGPGAGREQAILQLQHAGLKSPASRTSPRCRTTAAARRRSGACNAELPSCGLRVAMAADPRSSLDNRNSATRTTANYRASLGEAEVQMAPTVGAGTFRNSGEHARRDRS